ncbi:helix-hairpin-helix domain-containing protein [Arcanobacterium bovis]|nr:helix-hairpin-helix domain-containing protein [Arcanobacterium bovis]
MNQPPPRIIRTSNAREHGLSSSVTGIEDCSVVAPRRISDGSATTQQKLVGSYKRAAFSASLGDEAALLMQSAPKSRFVMSGSSLKVFLAVLVIAMAITIMRAVAVSGNAVHEIPSTPNNTDESARGGATNEKPGTGYRADIAEKQVEANKIVVYVTGAVNKPGLVTLNESARMNDAVEAAGGLSQNADTKEVNLAAQINDGEHIHIPVQGEQEMPASNTANSSLAKGNNNDPPSTTTKKVSLNSASVDELDALPGVGPVTAQQIVQWRQQHGKFSSIDQLGQISGIGAKTIEKLRPYLSL